MSRTKGYKCFNIKCGNCIGKTLCGEPEDTALGCADRVVGKPMTNAERIRAMSDEELVGFIRVIYMSEECPLGTLECETCFFKEVCAGKYFGKEIEWLQQPAEEDDHD